MTTTAKRRRFADWYGFSDNPTGGMRMKQYVRIIGVALLPHPPPSATFHSRAQEVVAVGYAIAASEGRGPWAKLWPGREGR